MALRNKPTAAFETEGAAAEGAAAVENVIEGTATVVEKTAESANDNAAGAEAGADEAGAAAPTAPAATTAVATAGKSLPAAAGGSKFQQALTEYQNVIDPASLDFDTFPRITVGLDGFSNDKEEELGKKLKLKLMSWNERFIVSPGVDNAEANEKVRYSLDGVTIDGTGESVAEYLKVLKEVDGYDEAAVKKYYTLYGFLTEKDGVPVDPVDQEIVAVQVPPRSVSLFTRYQIEQGVKIATKVVQPTDELFLIQEKIKGKSKTYASIKFSAK